ncbi:MAG: hypothetical protein QOK27_931 [Gemmatimonadales bacterium]|nr:hypothetical protein [Gemmatimonadales bacterium]
MSSPATVGAVYVMSNQDTGNSVTVFNRAADGSLTRGGTFPTGGLGAGNSISAQNDPLNSQGALTRSADGRFLFAVDAGSNEVTVLAIKGETLEPVHRVPTGGILPNSVTIHDNLLYVVNRGDATVAGFSVGNDGRLSSVGSPTPLGDPKATPAQVGFTPDGTQLVVTERRTGVIDVFAVDSNGHIGPPRKNTSSGPQPFGFTFAGQDLLIVSELGDAAASSYRIAPDGTLTVVSGSASTSELGACWVVTNSVTDPRFAYVSNSVSGTISGYNINPDGTLSLLTADGHTAITPDAHAALDSAVSSDGQFLYISTAGFNELSDRAVLCNKMTISAFKIGTDGSLGSLPGFGTADNDPRVANDPSLAVGLAPGSQGIVAV